MSTDDIETYGRKLGRVQAIVLELSVSLDRSAGGEIARNLAELYAYVHTRFVEADIDRDAGKVREGLGILRELRDAWAEGVRKLNLSGSAPDTPTLSVTT